VGSQFILLTIFYQRPYNEVSPQDSAGQGESGFHEPLSNEREASRFLVDVARNVHATL